MRDIVIVATADLKKLNNVLDELEKDFFFEHYKQLTLFYEYLAQTYNFDLKTHTVDPASGEMYLLVIKIRFILTK